MARPPRHPLLPAPAALVAALVATCLLALACDSGGADGACGEVVEVAIDPQSSQHLLPNAPEPRYRDDPPTSGPHLMGPQVAGAADEPLSRPVQVGVLERGDVLVQYAAADAALAAEARPLARPRTAESGAPGVVVAPNPDVEGVVLTAWGRRQACTAVDAGAVAAFVDAHGGGGSRMTG